jgi:PAS domain S-box-containing protein
MLLDLKLRDIEGKALIHHLESIGRLVPFIIVTGQTDGRVAVDMMKRGARDYLVKDVQLIEFVPTAVRHALDHVSKEKKLAKAEQALQQSARRLHRTLDGMLEGCQIIGLDWRYFYVNATAARHGRRRPEELLGHTLMELYPGIETTEMFGALRRCMEKRIPCFMENEFTFPDGAKALFEVSIQAVPEGIFVLSNDITERKRLEKEVLEISEREQSRIGQDLHDGLCQHLAGIEFRLLSLKHKIERRSRRPAPEAAETAELAKLVREGIEQTRTLARGLSPVMLEPDGLMNALQELAINTEKTFNISCACNCPSPVLIHDNALATHLYRIAQEAVHNAVRHGRAEIDCDQLYRDNGPDRAGS